MAKLALVIRNHEVQGEIIKRLMDGGYLLPPLQMIENEKRNVFWDPNFTSRIEGLDIESKFAE